MKQEPLITIFTPTYNRIDFLSRLYEDLKSQTSKNFIWLVIDDGSTDGTEDYFKTIIKDKIISIYYIKKQNGGKHTAYNLACEKTKTELIFISMDSDDRIKPDAVEKIEACWNENKNKGLAGMVFLCENPEGNYLYTTFNEHKLNGAVSWQEAYREGWFWGEAEYILKTEYIRNYLYPEYRGERFFNEAYTYMQMDAPLSWNKESIYVRDYQQNGLTDGFLKNVYRSPLGYADYNSVRYKICINKKSKLKAALYYNVFSMIGKRKHIINTAPSPALSFFLIPITLAIVIGLRFKLGRK